MVGEATGNATSRTTMSHNRAGAGGGSNYFSGGVIGYSPVSQFEAPECQPCPRFIS